MNRVWGGTDDINSLWEVITTYSKSEQYDAWCKLALEDLDDVRKAKPDSKSLVHPREFTSRDFNFTDYEREILNQHVSKRGKPHA
jgi:hypothetical protein